VAVVRDLLAAADIEAHARQLLEAIRPGQTEPRPRRGGGANPRR